MEISILLSVFLFAAFAAADVDPKELRCLVCRRTVDELMKNLQKLDPKKELEVGQYRLDAQGNTVHKKVPLTKSEIHISDTLDTICKELDNYAKSTFKKSGRLILLNLMNAFGGLNPLISRVDIIQDGDLNKSLKFLCQSIVDEFEEPIISLVQSGNPKIREILCVETAKYCVDDVDYIEEEEEEEVKKEDEEKEGEEKEEQKEEEAEEESETSDKSEL